MAKPAAASASTARIYDGQGDALIVDSQFSEKLTIIPDGKPSSRPDMTHRVRIMWGQHLLDDVLAGRYRTLVCAVNAHDNSHGIVSQLASLLPTSMWTPKTVTEYAQQFAGGDQTVVVKYDMDLVEVLALLRPGARAELTLGDLGHGFEVVAEMLRRKTERLPTAAVSFLGARANRLIETKTGAEPSFEAVLHTMSDAGFAGDVYPAPWMWDSQPTALYARYPFPDSVEKMRDGGY
ncbi:MAG: hypothetical protein AAGG38_12135 [Planctomycetota bacterium]